MIADSRIRVEVFGGSSRISAGVFGHTVVAVNSRQVKPAKAGIIAMGPASLRKRKDGKTHSRKGQRLRGGSEAQVPRKHVTCSMP